MSQAVVGIAGWSGSGKTSLLLRLIPEFKSRGLSVATIKHAHHDFDPDVPGKDSYRHRKAGAEQTLVASARRWAWICEQPPTEGESAEPSERRGAARESGQRPSLEFLMRRLLPSDLVLVEGFKRAPGLPKLEVHRPSLGKPLLAAADPMIFAIASDVPDLEAPCPVLPLDATARLADCILERLIPRKKPFPGFSKDQNAA